MSHRIVCTGQSFHDFKKQSDPYHFPDLFAKYVRSFGEIYFWEKGGFHIVTRIQHAKQVLMSQDFSADRSHFFISRMPKMDLGLLKDFFPVVKNMMVMSDGQDHARKRKAASVGFEDHILTQFEATMKRTVRELVTGIRGHDHFDFVSSVSKHLPSTVLADLFCIPVEDRPEFLRWSNTMTGFFGGASSYMNEDGIEVNEAALSLKNYFIRLMGKRRKNPGQDYVSLVLQTQAQIGISDEELISQLVMMLVAGMATTTDQINNCMFLLASNERLQREVALHKNLIPQTLEELKRFDPAVTFIFRVAKIATFIGDQPIQPGDVIFISNHSVNRDLPPEQNPFEIDIHRRVPHLAYGHGAHYCIGAKLARMEMISLFEELLTQLPAFEIDKNRSLERDHYSLSFSGFRSLPLRWA